MSATPSLDKSLEDWGLKALVKRLTRGVDHALFTPENGDLFADQKRPVAIYVGRVAIEKNIEAFLNMPWYGSKVVVGDGPMRESLAAIRPDVVFTGPRYGRDLAACYQSGDIFVFPSRTDTFGMVLVEAMSCGLPIAAYPVAGPADIVTEPMLGVLGEDLGQAAIRSLSAPGSRHDRHDHAAKYYNWVDTARQFVEISEAAFIKSN